jgi:nucleotide-binding universal stress UspA family protein
MLKVLLVIDGTPEGSAAIEHLIDLAIHQKQFQVILLCVRPRPSEWQKRRPSGDLLRDPDVEKTEHALAHACQRLDAAGIIYETRTFVGEVAQTVARVADGEDCDLIVVPQRPVGPFARTFLALTGLCVGTVVDKITPLASVPVTVVTRQVRGSARPDSRNSSSLVRITPLSSDERRGHVS